MPQAGKTYRYFRADADHDISNDPFAFSIDGGNTWITSTVTYIATGSLPPRPAAVDAGNPPAAGLTGYWWRVQTGPGNPMPLQLGRNVVRGKATDNPEEPHWAWVFDVGPYD